MKVAVVIPCYKVKDFIVNVVKSIPEIVTHIIVVDDACPDESGKLLQSHCSDTRVQVLFHLKNQGVGAAMVTGYRKALELDAEVIIKLDGDGQMDSRIIPIFISPIILGRADYTKGNRFFKRAFILEMPLIRLIGNTLLSFMTKLVTGYWKMMDPTNGYTAIHAKVLKQIDLDAVDQRYYFESDILFQLSLLKAMVIDIPITSHYAEEISSLRIGLVMRTWPTKMINRFVKRIILQYFIRDFSPASLELIVGVPFLIFGLVWGLLKYAANVRLGIHTPAGEVMIAAIPIIFGFQLILSAFHYDIEQTPNQSIHPNLP